MNIGRQISIISRITLFTGTVAVLLSAMLATVLMIAIDRYTMGYLARGGRRGRWPRGHRDGAGAAGLSPRGTPVPQHPDRRLTRWRGRLDSATSGQAGHDDVHPRNANMASSVVCGGVFPDGECNIVVAQRAHRGDEQWIVYSASPTIPPWKDPQLATLIGGGAVLPALAITYLGNRMAAASLRPVTAIRAELDEINAVPPGRRVPVPPTHDEIHDLARASTTRWAGCTPRCNSCRPRCNSSARWSPTSPMTCALRSPPYAPRWKTRSSRLRRPA